MIFGSVCSGIEAASMAWEPLGWRPAFFSEIDKFASRVLSHHYGSNMPGKKLSLNGVPNLGDMTKFEEWPDYAIDLLIGGTPCQTFSVAGLRKGLDDPRGNLMLIYGAVAQRYRPRWVAWENVPGVLSDDGGRGFASLLGLLTGRRVEVPRDGWRNAGIIPGYQGAYGLAWRVLDSQFIRVDGFGRAVPQRRRRVFVIGYIGDWRRAAAVLFEPESMRGNPPPRRSTKEDVAAFAASSIGSYVKSDISGSDRAAGGDNGGGSEVLISSTGNVPHCLNAGGMGRIDYESETMVAHSLRAEGFDASEDGTGRGTPIIPIAFNAREDPDVYYNRSGPLSAGSPQSQAVALDWKVRRLTTTECERLQGFPDGFTDIQHGGKPTPDGPRYKALGNSMSINTMRWLGTRIQMVEDLNL